MEGQCVNAPIIATQKALTAFVINRKFLQSFASLDDKDPVLALNATKAALSTG
jgi:hypothetical protein